MNYNDLVVKYFNEFHNTPFPYENYKLDYLKDLVNKLYVVKCDKLSFRNDCIQVINHFHKSLWDAHKYNRLSPHQAWYDNELLIRCIENRLKYKGDNLTPIDIRSGFTISMIAPKVSIFRPYIAKYLINKYLKEFDTIFDPCMGYSGRLLGCISLNKYYIGQDINPLTVLESINLCKQLDITYINLSVKNSLGSFGEYDSLFTCPPYGEKENWNQDIEVLTADEWIDNCLKNYKCKKYLFVVDKTTKYKNYIVEELTSKSHFSGNTEYVILI